MNIIIENTVNKTKTMKNKKNEIADYLKKTSQHLFFSEKTGFFTICYNEETPMKIKILSGEEVKILALEPWQYSKNWLKSNLFPHYSNYYVPGTYNWVTGNQDNLKAVKKTKLLRAMITEKFKD